MRPLRPWIVSLLVVGTAFLTYRVPALARFRPASPEALLHAATQSRSRLAEALRPDPALAQTPRPDVGSPQATGSDRAPLPSRPIPGQAIQGPFLEDPSGALEPFREALARARAGEGTVRVAHFGDSPVTGDLISGEARARLQALAGDSGHGWILPGRPWEWYGHLGVDLEDRGWRIQTPTLGARADHAYGYALAAFTGRAGARARIRAGKSHPFDRLEIHYLAQPMGGHLEIQVDKGEVRTLSTRGEAGPAVERLILAQEAHTVEVHPRGDGEVTLYGLALERDAPGAVWDALGANGGAVQHLAHCRGAQWIQALALRRPDLVILAYGTNETGYANIPGPAYVRDYAEVIRRVRAAAPQAAILVMAPMDRGERLPTGEIGTMPAIRAIVEAQRRIALEQGCAFFDTWRAMGADGAAGRWYHASPRLMSGDFTHPSRQGADLLAHILVEELAQPPVSARAGAPTRR